MANEPEHQHGTEADPSSGDHHDGHSHAPELSPAARAEALQAVLVERGIVDPERARALANRLENDLSPTIGAAVVAKAWVDPDFKQRLLTEPDATIAGMGVAGAEMEHIEVKENRPGTHNVVVCTLCSCYPWALLGLPPDWYKSPEYRARVVREPRTVLAEMGLNLAESTQVNVWDSSAETRYLVLPERPAGTDAMTEAELAGLVSRDSMVGVALADSP